MAYTLDRPLRGPEELGESGGVPADWHTELVDRSRSPAHYIIVQFGSINVSREEAERIIADMLAGLNRAETVDTVEQVLRDRNRSDTLARAGIK